MSRCQTGFCCQLEYASRRRCVNAGRYTARVCWMWLAFIATLVTIGGCNTSAENKSASSAVVESDGTAPSARGTRPLRVVVTVGMLADLVKQIGGEQVAVQTLMGEGIDPHLYKPTRGDVQAIVKADVVFYCGLMLEGKMTDNLATLGKDKRVVAVGAKLPVEQLMGDTTEGGHPDPHVWMDVALWSQSLDSILATLSEFEQIDRVQMQQRCDELRARMQQVHDYGQLVIKTIPPESRLLVTSHDAFSYFGRAYGLEVAGVQGISTESEAGLQRINELVDLLVARQVPSVFVESSVPQKSLESIVTGARSRGLNVRLGGPLYSDAMGAKNSPTGTYLGMMIHNFELIAEGLGGKIDPNLRPK